MSMQTEFLKQFTKELIINSLSREDFERLKRNKLNQRVIKPFIEEKPVFKPITVKNNIPPILRIEKQPEAIQKDKNENDYYGNLYLGKLIPFVLDPEVISIECPGPGKFVSIKKMGKIMITRTILNRENIQEIIDSFSQESKIPLIGGVFKAIVKNLVITSIESVYGARFIITKSSIKPSNYL